MKQRSNDLAIRLEAGAAALIRYAASLTDAEWKLAIPHDGRTVGVIVHHVSNMYPLEIQLAQLVAQGKPVEGVTWDVVAQVNADHAGAFASVDKQTAIAAVEKTSRDAAAAVRAFSDEELDRAAPVSLNADAPLTAQFVIEDHALRHSYHHLAKIRATVEAAREAGRRAA